jgi:hypothetical protein
MQAEDRERIHCNIGGLDSPLCVHMLLFCCRMCLIYCVKARHWVWKYRHRSKFYCAESDGVRIPQSRWDYHSRKLCIYRRRGAVKQSHITIRGLGGTFAFHPDNTQPWNRNEYTEGFRKGILIFRLYVYYLLSKIMQPTTNFASRAAGPLLSTSTVSSWDSNSDPQRPMPSSFLSVTTWDLSLLFSASHCFGKVWVL